MIAAITAYCICILCCGPWAQHGGITKSGYHGIPGLTAACSRERLGQVIWIEGLGFRICEDTGSAIKGSRVDVLMGSHDEARKFGRQLREVQNVLQHAGHEG